MTYFRDFYGNNSPVNLVGKILLTPVALPIFALWAIMDLLFIKSKRYPED